MWLCHQDADPGAVRGLDLAPGALGMHVARDPARLLDAPWLFGGRVAGGDHAAVGFQLPVAVAVQEGQAVWHPAWQEAADGVPQHRVKQSFCLQLDAVSTVQPNGLGLAEGGGVLRERRCGVGAI